MADAQIVIPAGNSNKNHKYILIGLSIILCLAVIVAAIYIAYFVIPAKVHYHVTERYRFSSEGDNASIFLGVMVPKSGPYQTVENLEIFWNGGHEVEDRDFIEVVKLTGEMNNKEEFEAVLAYDVILPQAKVSWSGPVDEDDLSAQLGIECDNQIIMAQASNITDGFSGNDAFRIFEYTSDNLSYSAIDKDITSRSAIQAYQFGNCACAGFTRLMIALCRASGIPSKFVVGSILPKLDLYGSAQSYDSGHPGEAHAWVEYFSEERWSLADPTLGSGQLNVLSFNRNDARHLFYGEYNQLWEVYQDIYAWAASRGQIVEPEEDAFKFVFASASSDTSISSVITVSKGWDGRWLNTLLVWGLTTFVMCQVRNKFFSPPR